MRANSLESAGWPLRKWIFVGLGVLGIQICFLALLGAKTAPNVTQERNFITTPPSSSAGANPLLTENPAAFVLPNREGFSGPAWIQSRKQEIAVKDWSDKPHPLQPQVEKLTDDLNSLLKSPAPSNFGESIPGDGMRYDPPGLEMNAPSRSELTIEGDLTRLKLINPPQLENVATTETGASLDATSVRTGVDRNGEVISAILVGKSGSAAADQLALRIAAKSRFQIPGSNDPALSREEQITWGTLVFHWQAGDTNLNKSAHGQ